ncbi:transmembrane protein 223 [Astyanax mexicanus]|uniref:Transmembrane protein 223 n=1 Tax=Astyanax mexicanus TaxID=7994 RepID=A0A8B9JT07_ASTMX|nr:transmembrane protein 223 [Astyanax mexicanus]
MGFLCLFLAARVCGLRSAGSLLSVRRTVVQNLRDFSAVSKRCVQISDKTAGLNLVTPPVRPPALYTGAISPRLWRGCHSAVVRDVLLFEHDRTRFFRLLALFCGGQFLFWTYLAYFAFTGLRDTSKSGKEPRKVRTDLGLFSFDMNLGSNAWRFGFTLSCLVIGGGIVGLGLLFSRRSVSCVLLHKGGGKVTVQTQSPLGASNAWHLTVPLNQVACHAHRQESPSFIPLKVKDHKFYFLLDKEGTLNNPKLFDITVGAYRHL